MRTKKFISVLLSALMLVSILPVVSFAADSVSIQGPATLVSAPEGMYSKLAYVATYTPDSGTEVTSTDAPDSFTWTVKKGEAAATDVFFEDGNLIVAGGANGSYTLESTYNGVKGTLGITIAASTVANHGTITTHQDISSSDSINMSGTKTVEFTLSIDNANVTSGKTALLLTYLNDSTDWSACYYIEDAADGTYKVYISGVTNDSGYCEMRGGVGAGAEVIKLKYGEEQQFKLVYNLDDKTLMIYINNVLCKYTYGHNGIFNLNAENNLNKFTLRNNVKPAFSSFVEYSGVETEYTPPAPPEPSVTNNSSKKIFIPFGGRAVQTKCLATVENTSANIAWSILTPYTGVTIDENTGVLTVRDTAAAGSVTVRATVGDVYDDAVITLNKIEDSINASTSWYAGTPTPDGDNYYMAPSLRYRIPEAMYNNTDSDFYIVFEADIRSTSSEYNPALFMTASNGGYYNFETAKVRSADWVNLKIIVNPANGKFRAYIDDAPMKLYASGYSNVDELTMVSGNNEYPIAMRDIGSSNCQFDNLRVYNISNNPATVDSFDFPWYAAVDGEIAVTEISSTNTDMNDVTYEYKWFTCDKNGENEAEIPGQSDDVLDLSALNLGECFVKVKVRANHRSILAGDTTVIEGIWKESGLCQVADFVIGGPTLTINGVKGDINNIVISEDNTTVTLIVSPLYTIEGRSKNVLIALAVYDTASGTKTLDNISATSCASTFGWNYDTTITLDKLAKGSIVRAFIWDADTLAPIEY